MRTLHFCDAIGRCRIQSRMARGLVLFTILLACGGTSRPTESAATSQGENNAGAVARLEAHVRFLADDLLAGRGTPGPGVDIAARYIAEQLRAYGVAPMRGRFLRRYELREYQLGEDSVAVSLAGAELSAAEHASVTAGIEPNKDPLSLSLVFAGFGRFIPEKGWDDYGELDARGKAVVVFTGGPDGPAPTITIGPTAPVGKAIAAFEHGARLLVYVTHEFAGPGEEIASTAQRSARRYSSLPQTLLPALHGKPSAGFVPAVVISASTFDRLLAERAGGRYDALRDRLTKGETIAKSLELPVEVSVKAETRNARAFNVAGAIRGSKAPDEWVVLTAHFDHLGSYPTTDGADGILNGADDNASGTAALLEIARRLARRPLERSVMLLFVSGEEKGLLGSAAYSAEPLVPFDRVVANINVDMVGRSRGTLEVVTPVADLVEASRAAGKRHAIAIAANPQPTWRLEYLSDFYHFLHAGVPALTFTTGLHEDYHKPSDEADKIRLAEMARVVDVIEDVLGHYADSARSRPTVPERRR